MAQSVGTIHLLINNSKHDYDGDSVACVQEVSWSHMDLRYWFNPQLFPTGSPGRNAATTFVRGRYGNDVAKLNEAYNCSVASFDELSDCISPVAQRWQCQRDSSGNVLSMGWPPGLNVHQLTQDSTDFILVFAEKYFEVVTQAIRRYDTNHLLFGMRGGCFGSHSLLTLFAKYVDVYDVHKYNDNLGIDALLEECVTEICLLFHAVSLSARMDCDLMIWSVTVRARSSGT